MNVNKIPGWARFAIVSGLLLILMLVTYGHINSAMETSYTLRWWTVDAGGGDTAVSGVSGYALQSTIGQADAAIWSGGGYTLTGGFWSESEPEYVVYLPQNLRNVP